MAAMRLADLFCGAGGTSAGAVEAIQALGYRADLTAINHWPVAVATHELNHPDARHLCTSIDNVNPRDLFPDGQLDLLWASPECTHHSIARGGKPINDQSRATAWCVIRWAEALRPNVILVENVPEFISWGGIGTNGRPLKTKKGETFRAWKSALQSLGYHVEHRILCAADYGDPTSRKRLFVQAVRGRRRCVWPVPTHAANPGPELMKWRAAREIIDWSIPGKSIFDRKKPLSEKTMLRIVAGLKKFGLRSFVVAMEHGGHVRSVDVPLNTITTAKGGAHALVEAFLIQLRGTTEKQVESSGRSLDLPIPALTAGGGHIALIEPYLVEYYGNGKAQSVEVPLGTATTKPRFGLAIPIVQWQVDSYMLDIRFRMLQPRELAGGQGFPDHYQFTGTIEEQVKQIGNAVPRRLARAIVLAALSQDPDIRRHVFEDERRAA